MPPPLVPEIPGAKAEPHLANQFRREVAELLGRDNVNFPGAQPVSFARKHLTELQRQNYYVCEKSDGIRCLMYCTDDGQGQEIHYLIDRKNDFYFITGLHFPLVGDIQAFHTKTLIDGELVLDKNKNGQLVLKYLVFDCMVLDGKTLVKRPLDKRLGYFREHFFIPYEDLCKQYPDEMQYFPFFLQFKHMEVSYAIEKMFKEILPRLKHGNDGLIFTCVESEYKFGTDDKILKWKPADENSVDFRQTLEFPILSDSENEDGNGSGSPKYDWYAKPQIFLSVNAGNNRYERWAEMYMEDTEWDQLKAMNVELDERIVECAMDEQKRWRFKRFRNDKKDGNHISVVRSVMESIEDGIGKEDLLRVSGPIREAWHRRRDEFKRAAAAQAQTQAKAQAGRSR